MYQFNFDYKANDKHLTATVTDIPVIIEGA